MPEPKHSEFYRGFFEKLGQLSIDRVSITLTPDHQNTLLQMLSDYKKQESLLCDLKRYRINTEAFISRAEGQPIKDFQGPKTASIRGL